MRTVTKDDITDTFRATFDEDTEPRLRFVLDRLAHHLHAFAKETELTHDEWRAGLEFLGRAGEISDDERNEFVLLSDVLGLSSLVDMIQTRTDMTPSSVLGPFHILGAPDLLYGGDLKRNNDGPTVVMTGRVRAVDGMPIAGAEIEFWQASNNGLYSNQDPAQSRYNLRCRMRTNAEGRFLLTTVRPQCYAVPDDGPVGDLLRATGRHPWRPAHYHFIIVAEGYCSLVTEVFPDDDPYLDEDAVFGVRKDLIVHHEERTDPSTVPPDLEAAERLTNPFLYVAFDFVLGSEAE